MQILSSFCSAWVLHQQVFDEAIPESGSFRSRPVLKCKGPRPAFFLTISLRFQHQRNFACFGERSMEWAGCLKKCRMRLAQCPTTTFLHLGHQGRRRCACYIEGMLMSSQLGVHCRICRHCTVTSSLAHRHHDTSWPLRRFLLFYAFRFRDYDTRQHTGHNMIKTMR
eukprot:1209906-Pleurochrysis_carterae.AAC.3